MRYVSRESGAGLVAVLVGIAIAGILMAALTNYLSVAIKVSHQLNEIDNIESLRRNFRVRLNCVSTIGAIPNCSAGSNVAMRQKSGGVFIRNPHGGNYSKSGKYFLRAECAGNYSPSSPVLQFVIKYSKDKSKWDDLFEFPVACQRI